MAFTPNFAVTQGTDCTIATVTDNSDSSTENIPAQRTAYEELTPSASSGKTSVRLQFTSGSTLVNLAIAILSGDTVAEKCTKIAAGINGNTTIAAIVTAVAGATLVTVTADAEDVAFTFTSEVEESTDLAVTVADFPYSSRQITVTYPNQDTTIIPFPYVNGQGDSIDITGLTQDYSLNLNCEITPQVVVEGSVYSQVLTPVLVCNVNTCRSTKIAALLPELCGVECGDAKVAGLETIDGLIMAAQFRASASDQTGSQELLDQANSLCENNCGC